ncbi:MAG: hypothetical protein HXY22_01860 [Alphaproteobacteria bacterium]|nr:hypothetical protein [Alphaproteobacteria bacterium]
MRARDFLAMSMAASLVDPAAHAQQPQAALQCQGRYEQQMLQGPVYASLWMSDGGQTTIGNYLPFLYLGELHKLPGRVQLFGWLTDAAGNIVNFETFLHPNGEGTGAVWVNHQAHRQTYMRLVLKPKGFDIFLETGGVASFSCTL